MNVKINIAKDGKQVRWTAYEDIVFLLRQGKIVQTIFALGWIGAGTDVSIAEQSTPDEVGVAAGIGLHRITGTVTIPQNAANTINQIMQSQGERFEMYILKRNGDFFSVPGVTSTGKPQDYGVGFYSFIKSRYPFIDTWRDLFGVRFTLSQKGGGVNNLLTFSVDGWTPDVSVHTVKSSAEFYRLFPTLDRGLPTALPQIYLGGK